MSAVQSVSIKSLAARVLQEMAAHRSATGVCPTPETVAGQTAERSKARISGAQPLAACGSSHCAGCYDVGDGRRIHPPKCGEKYRLWLDRWEAKGRVQ
jgi:hypothetical protein